MNKIDYLKEFGLKIESLFGNYKVTLFYGSDGEVTDMIIHATNNLFSCAFLRFLLDRLQGWLFCFKCDDNGRPIIKIFVFENDFDL